jgi:DMSO reductase family type II enzyme chaperone
VKESTMGHETGLSESGIGPAAASSARAHVYAILSACFAPPTPELLEAAQGGVLVEALAEALAELPAERRRLEAALRAFEALPRELGPCGPCGTMETLEVEYTRLFEGPGLPAVPPYESVYVDREEADVPGQLWGQTSFAVRGAYQQAGLTPRPGPEPPDHLAAELEFMAFLSQREAAALADGDLQEAESMRQRRTSFLTDHLRRWAPVVAEKVAQEARHPLYEAAGRLLQTVVAADT